MATTVLPVNTAAGLISMLDEPEYELKTYTLKKLNEMVDQFWPEMADSISKVEILYEEENYEYRKLAALVASKVYYHLGVMEESLKFALGAGDLFDVSQNTLYIQTIIAFAVDKYVQARAKGLDEIELKEIVERMFQKCLEQNQFKQAIGISLEAQRLDLFKISLGECYTASGTLSYATELLLGHVENRTFRNHALRKVVQFHREIPEPNYESICQCLITLNEPQEVTKILVSLLESSDEDKLLHLYQISFDLYENATQEFLRKVRESLPSIESPSATSTSPSQGENMEVDSKKEETADGLNKDKNEIVKNIHLILTGETTIGLYLEFLYRNIHTDYLILKNTKAAVESRTAVYHTATIFSNSLMHSGTTVDTFLRDNLEWLGKATNWAKFSATASLGAIHKGHITQGKNLLNPYLPRPGSQGSPYFEGGSLYALGLIHANHGKDIIDYLLQQLSENTTEIVQHGACLGLGVAGMATADQGIFETLKGILFADSAVAGEAAGLAMGLIMIGTANTAAVTEMLQYAKDTQHEKIIRGLAIGIALIMYRVEEEADTLVDQLCAEKDPILRYGAMFVIAMAYAGSSNTRAIRRLLHVAVSDVNDDVRKASVIALGFLLFRHPEQCPPLVRLLCESFNPFVRYGATLALGISCAGTGLQEAIDLLEPMTEDRVDYVRQGAFIALAMILMQQNEQLCPKAPKVRKLYEKVINDKHEDVMAKFGAILSQGIIDAGGGNVSISLLSKSGQCRLPAVVGLCLFAQYWFWYPLIHMINLSFVPTALIGLNKDLKMPQIVFETSHKPGAFAYPPKTVPPVTEKVEKVAAAVLSTTIKAKARAQRAEKAQTPASTVPSSPAPAAAPSRTASTDTGSSAMDITGTTTESSATSAESEMKKSVPDVLTNPARVLPAQKKYVSFPANSRYRPIKKGPLFGVILLKDTQPEAEETLIQLSAPQATPTTTTAAPDEGPEPNPPEPFEYTD